jgi:RNA polymerase sigma factor (sigma-70 family)
VTAFKQLAANCRRWVGKLLRPRCLIHKRTPNRDECMNRPRDPERIDADLLGRLLDEHGPALALYASQWTDAADDCVQEALVELARQSAIPENLRAWLYRVVKYRALNAARSTRRRRDRESRALANRLVTTGPASESRLDALAATEALEQLEPDAREIVVMKIWGGLTFEEIASALSLSISTTHRQYHQALERLRQFLESPCSTDKNPKASRSQPN